MSLRDRLVGLTLFAAAGGLVALGASRYGLGLSPDSLTYLDGSHALLRGEGYVNGIGSPIIAWPPLFSAILAALALLPLPEGAVQIALQALLLGFCAASVWWMCRPGDRWLAGLAATAVLASFPLLKISTMLWSEPLFTALSLIALAMTARACSDRGNRALEVATLAAAAAILTRLPGIATIAACALLLLRHRGLRQAVLFATAAMLPVSLWILRNAWLTGSPTGPRHPSKYTLAEVFAQLHAATSVAFLPDASVVWMVALLLAGLVALTFAARGIATLTPRARLLLEVNAYFVVAYTLFVFVSAARTELEAIQVRYVAPAMPMVATVLALLVGAGTAETRSARRVPGLLFFALWTCFNLSTAIKVEQIWAAEGAGDFSTDLWQLSPTLAAARQTQYTQRVFSNVHDFLAHEIGHRVAPLPPPSESVEDIRQHFRTGDTIVWFHSGFRTYQIQPQALASVVPLAVQSELPDGVILTVVGPAAPAGSE